MSARQSSRRRNSDGKQALSFTLGGKDHTLRLDHDASAAFGELTEYFERQFPGCRAKSKNAVIFNTGAGSKHSISINFKTKESACGRPYLYGKSKCGVYICSGCRAGRGDQKKEAAGKKRGGAKEKEEEVPTAKKRKMKK
jgi:hypothetical protein